MVAVLIYMGFLSLFSIGIIHYYEDQIRKVKLNSQVDNNHELKEQIRSIDADNEALNKLVKQLKLQLAEANINRAGSQEIQYESHIYKNTTWDNSKYETIIDL
jgi:cell division protein FtsB